ncbi:TIGR02444 family protein [Hyphococcus sp. DH-69]|uniref:TIGR02444 family protein n=1 Tax=Hyphococcus formosus TaxID=3143534 RepID=UPI00398B7EBB
MGAEPADTPFWHWSLAHYGAAEQSLLRLQDEFDCDVNIILFCCWCAEEFEALSEKEMASALDLARSWTDKIVHPLRSVRRSLSKTNPAESDLRGMVKDTELSAEKILQDMLFNFADENLSRSKNVNSAIIAQQNLLRYDAHLKPPNDVRVTLLKELISHIFDAAKRQEAK